MDARRRSRFGDWFRALDAAAAARATAALYRIGQGNLSNVKPLGHGLHEYRIDSGPGYRIYLGFRGPDTVVLLAGGSKRRQAADIAQARAAWRNYLASIR